MINDDAPVGRVLNRREALRAMAFTGIGLAAARFMGGVARAQTLPSTQPSLPLIASPSLTEGPFFVDEKLNRSDLVAGTTRESGVCGLKRVLSFTVYKWADNKGVPLKDAQVDVWHADVAGSYSDETDPMNHENTARQPWL